MTISAVMARRAKKRKHRAAVVELADTGDLKSSTPSVYGFDSRWRYHVGASFVSLAPKLKRRCVTVAHQTLTLAVQVRVLPPLPCGQIAVAVKKINRLEMGKTLCTPFKCKLSR